MDKKTESVRHADSADMGAVLAECRQRFEELGDEMRALVEALDETLAPLRNQIAAMRHAIRGNTSTFEAPFVLLAWARETAGEA